MLALSGNQTGMGRVFGTQAILYIRHSNWQANVEEILIRCCERYSVRILLQVFLFIFATYVARYNWGAFWKKASSIDALNRLTRFRSFTSGCLLSITFELIIIVALAELCHFYIYEMKKNFEIISLENTRATFTYLSHTYKLIEFKWLDEKWSEQREEGQELERIFPIN